MFYDEQGKASFFLVMNKWKETFFVAVCFDSGRCRYSHGMDFKTEELLGIEDYRTDKDTASRIAKEVTNLSKLSLVQAFIKTQTSENLNALLNEGLTVCRLINGTWKRISDYELPLNNVLPLYNDELELDSVGTFN